MATSKPTSSMCNRKIFISYRRTDSQDATGRLYDGLAAHFRRDAIFRDVDNLGLGEDFPQKLNEALDQCGVLLAVIGPSWVDTLNKRNPRGINSCPDQPDFVRLEIEMALQRGIHVIPVVVSHAQMPRPSDLPESLRPLVSRHAAKVRPDNDHDRDMARLLRALEEILRESGEKTPTRLSDSQVEMKSSPPAGSPREQLVTLLTELWHGFDSETHAKRIRKQLLKNFPGDFHQWRGNDGLEDKETLALIILHSGYQYPGKILAECQALCEHIAERLAQQGYFDRAIRKIYSMPGEHRDSELIRDFQDRSKAYTKNESDLIYALQIQSDNLLRDVVTTRLRLVPLEPFVQRLVNHQWLLLRVFSSLREFDHICHLRGSIQTLLSVVPIVLMVIAIILGSVGLLYVVANSGRVVNIYTQYSLWLGTACASVLSALSWRRKLRTRRVLLTEHPYSHVTSQWGGESILMRRVKLKVIRDGIELFIGSEALHAKGVTWTTAKKSDLSEDNYVIMCVVGKRPGGQAFWSYLAVPNDNYLLFKEAEARGNYTLDDYGTIIAYGEGSTGPPDIVIEYMRKEFGIGPASWVVRLGVWWNT